MWLIPIVTALIGWGTNVIAVRMLFRPRRPINLLFMRLHGVIPKRKAALAGSLADVVESELFSNDDLRSRFDNLNIEGEVGSVLDTRIDNFLDGLSTSMPMLKMFLNDSLKESISGKLKAEVLGAIPELKARLGTSLASEIDMRAVVEEKVLNFSEAKLEQVILRVMRKELRSVELFGGLLGLLIGLAQLALMSLL